MQQLLIHDAAKNKAVDAGGFYWGRRFSGNGSNRMVAACFKDNFTTNLQKNHIFLCDIR